MTNTLQIGARTAARNAVRESIADVQWQRNDTFTRELSTELQQHAFVQHPLIAAMNAGEGSLEWLRGFYLDTVHAVSGRFIDYVLQAVLNCAQIEDRIGRRGVTAARFLLQINVIDELGFEPGASVEGFIGNPGKAHVLQLYDVLEQLGISEAMVRAHRASSAAIHMANVLETNRNDHLRLATVLAAYESTLSPWSDCWATATRALSTVDTGRGYHAIHVEDHDGHVVDDDHSEDSWHIVRQALTLERTEEVRHLALHLMDTCQSYVDYQFRLLRTQSRSPVYA
ncbi:iron-containing redox enzyme family protein [Variovorax sp. OV700]|uniref:iron-containing redox enzyme family protein n=1 Tax=Variovorax sp. OV700 TaxID=1882826 RepID=UPI00089101EA|nr:iron-containing redox enzyme family protein [Variovorax sp. OV700]SDH56340.1 Pyrroloquinoline quinone (PQQ) biosynthesis protein C [Variovorax sp. OV700]